MQKRRKYKKQESVTDALESMLEESRKQKNHKKPHATAEYDKVDSAILDMMELEEFGPASIEFPMGYTRIEITKHIRDILKNYPGLKWKDEWLPHEGDGTLNLIAHDATSQMRITIRQDDVPRMYADTVLERCTVNIKKIPLSHCHSCGLPKLVDRSGSGHRRRPTAKHY